MAAHNNKMHKKAQFVKRMAVRRYGKVNGELRFFRSRWAAYDSLANLEQNIRDQKYADVLQGNPYVRAEAERRVYELGWYVENCIRNTVHEFNADPNHWATVHREVAARFERNDPVFESEVENMMEQV